MGFTKYVTSTGKYNELTKNISYFNLVLNTLTSSLSAPSLLDWLESDRGEAFGASIRSI